MRLTGLPALRANAWVLWGIGALLLFEDLADWWLAGGQLPHLLEALGFLACGNAVEHARQLLARHGAPLTGDSPAPRLPSP
jgi:hypothetical protein